MEVRSKRCIDVQSLTRCRGDGRRAIPSQRDGSRYASFSWTRMSPTSCPSRPVCRPSSPGDCRCSQSTPCLAKTLIRMTTTAAAGSNFLPSRPDRLSLSIVLICSLLLRKYKYCPHKRAHRPCSQLQTMKRLNAFSLPPAPFLPAPDRLSRDVIVIETGDREIQKEIEGERKRPERIAIPTTVLSDLLILLLFAPFSGTEVTAAAFPYNLVPSLSSSSSSAASSASGSSASSSPRLGETIYSSMLLSHSPMPPASPSGESSHSSVLLSSKSGTVIPCQKPMSSGSPALTKEDVKWQVWSESNFMEAKAIPGSRIFRDDGSMIIMPFKEIIPSVHQNIYRCLISSSRLGVIASRKIAVRPGQCSRSSLLLVDLASFMSREIYMYVFLMFVRSLCWRIDTQTAAPVCSVFAEWVSHFTFVLMPLFTDVIICSG